MRPVTARQLHLQDFVGDSEHVGVSAAMRRLEFVARKLKHLAQRISEIERIHETSVNLSRVGETGLL